MKGTAIIAAFILIVIGSLIVGGLLLYISRESHMTERLNDSIKALYIAEAGLERKIYEILNEDDGDISDPIYFPDPDDTDNFYTVDVVQDGSRYIVTSTGRYYQGERIVQLNVELVNIWDTAIFAAGLTVRQIVGNTQARGTVYVFGEESFIDTFVDNGYNIFDYTDNNDNGIYDVGDTALDTIIDETGGTAGFRDHLSSSGNAIDGSGHFYIGNNYGSLPGRPGISSTSLITFYDRIHSLGSDTLNAELNVKYGTINLDGSSRVGYEDPPGPWMDTVNVPDGFPDDYIDTRIYSDRILYNRDRFSDKLRFPNLNDVIDDSGTTRLDDLINNGYPVPPQIITPDSDIPYSEDSNGNGFGVGVDPVTGDTVITINGIVCVTGDLTIDGATGHGPPRNTMHYEGEGTIVVTGNLTVNTNLYTENTNADYSDGTSAYPENNIIGFMTPNNIQLGLPGGSNWEMMAIFYAGGTISLRINPRIAGTLISNNLNMGTNNPRIFQVRDIWENLPDGMIDIPPVLVIYGWHEVF